MVLVHVTGSEIFHGWYLSCNRSRKKMRIGTKSNDLFSVLEPVTTRQFQFLKWIPSTRAHPSSTNVLLLIGQ